MWGGSVGWSKRRVSGRVDLSLASNEKHTVMVGMKFPRLFLSLCLLPLMLQAAEITVDAQAGDDANSGAANAPLKTLEAAFAKAQVGDVIYLKPGDYADFTFRGGLDQHLFAGEGMVTIQPAPGVDNPQESISIGRMTFGVRAGSFSGEDGRGVFDINLRVEGVKLRDGVYTFGGRNMELVNCRIERAPPWVGSVEAIEKFAVVFGAGDGLVVEGCEITNTAGGIVLSTVNGIARNNKIHDITHDGIRCVSTKNTLVEGNDIWNLDDGVEDGDPRGEGWNRHCDAIHIFIPGPGVPGAENDGVIIRGNRMWNCESQAMQFNNYLRNDELWNKNITIENNIFGPTRANVVNIADPVDGIIVRNNTYVFFPEGRTFQGLGREIHCDNHTFRITPRCKNAQVYNNIFSNSAPALPGWFVGYNLLVNPSPNNFPTRTDIVVSELQFVDREAFDGKLPADSPAINAGTRLAPAGSVATDFYGTPRDLRPDIGAYELPGQNPPAEAPLPTFTGPAKVYLDDFLDGSIAADDWLNGPGQQGLSWVAPDGQKSWGAQKLSDASGDPAAFSGLGIKDESWMISEVADLQDIVVTQRIRNAYNDRGAGVLLRGNAATEGYLVDLATGTISARKLDSGGSIASKELASNGENYLPRTMYRTFVYAVTDTPAGVKITLDADGDGTVDVEAIDENRTFAQGAIGLYNNSKNGSHRTDVTNVEVALQ